jgi:hypothetical protein
MAPPFPAASERAGADELLLLDQLDLQPLHLPLVGLLVHLRGGLRGLLD